MGGEFGTKELEEAIVGVMEVGLTLASGFKDGVQFGDFVEFWNKYQDDAVFKQRIQEAYQGISGVPDEVGELDAEDIIRVIALVLPYIPKIIDALKPAPVE